MATEKLPVAEKDRVRILIVDDDTSMLRLVSHECRNRFTTSAEVFTCHEATEAISLCEKLDIHVLVTDLDMGKLNGFHLLKFAKRERPFMQVVIMTGSDSANAIESALALGADDYFVKPVAASLLVDSVAFMASRVFRWKASIPQLELQQLAAVEPDDADLSVH